MNPFTALVRDFLIPTMDKPQECFGETFKKWNNEWKNGLGVSLCALLLCVGEQGNST
jgi:hypothetical protein